jgi:hypothetical protein
MTNDRNDEIVARCGHAAGARGGRTDKGFPQYNPYGYSGHNWHIWNDAFARGAREAGHVVKADHDGSNYIERAKSDWYVREQLECSAAELQMACAFAHRQMSSALPGMPRTAANWQLEAAEDHEKMRQRLERLLEAVR